MKALNWASVAVLVAAVIWRATPLPFDPISVSVVNNTVRFAREIHSDFTGAYSVVVRRARDNLVVCENTAGPFTYRSDSTLPEEITLDWWVGEACNPPGDEYYMESCWRVWLLDILPPRTICLTTAPFVWYNREAFMGEARGL